MQGELAEGLLPGLLRKLYVEHLSAALHLQRSAVRRTFLFRGGQIVGLDGLTPAAGDDVVRAHVRQAIEESLGWKDGSFHLEELDPKAPPLATAALKVPTGDLILDGVRRLGPRAVELGLGDTSRLVQLSTDPMLRFQPLALTPEDGYVVSRVNGTFSADELLEFTTFDREKLRHSLYALLCTGVVEYVQGTGSRRAPKPVAAPAPPRVEAPAPPPPPPPPPPVAAPPLPPPAPPKPAAPPPAAPRPTAPRPAATAVAPPVMTVKTSWTPGPPKATVAPAPPPAPAAPPPPTSAEVVARERREEIETAFAALKEQDHFEVLGLERTATGAQVKESYFKRARRYHPDVLAHDPALADLRDKMEAVFIRLGQAYEILKSPIARSAYERNLPSLPVPASEAPSPAPPEVGEEAAAPVPRGPSLEDVVRLTAEVRKGEKLLADGRDFDAIEFLEPLVLELSGRLKARAQVTLARSYAQHPKGARRAEKLLMNVIAEDPKYVEAHLALGRIYRGSGMKARTLAAFRKALELDPDHEEALAVVAELAPEAGEPDDDGPGEGGGLIRKLFKKS